MSAGIFSRSKYESNRGDVYAVLVQEETEDLLIGASVNGPIGTAINAEVSAQVGGSRRSIGMHTRGVRLAFTGSVPAGYAPGSVTFVPILTKAVFDGISRFDTGTYLAAAVQVIGLVEEKKR